MSRRIIVRPEAEADIVDAAMWYDSREAGLGLELVSEVRSAISRALISPESFLRVRRNPPVRRVLTRRFFEVFPQCMSVSARRCEYHSGRAWVYIEFSKSRFIKKARARMLGARLPARWDSPLMLMPNC